MTTEWSTDQVEGYRVKTLTYKGNTITILRPLLSPAEQSRREREVKEALSRYLVSLIHTEEALSR